MTDEVTYTLVIDGACVPVTNLFDDCGEEVQRWEEAERFVAGPMTDGTWLADFTDKYDVRRPH